jgi:hypothetical protein
MALSSFDKCFLETIVYGLQAEMQLTFSVASKAVAVSEWVENMDSAVAAPGTAEVILNSRFLASSLTATVRADASFELPSVFPGSYLASVTFPASLQKISP